MFPLDVSYFVIELLFVVLCKEQKMECEIENENENISEKTKKIAKKVNINIPDDELMDILSSHFKRDESTNKIACQVTDCKSTISRWQLYFFK